MDASLDDIMSATYDSVEESVRLRLKEVDQKYQVHTTLPYSYAFE